MTRFLIHWLIMTIACAVTVVLLPGMVPVGTPPLLGRRIVG